MTVTKKDRRSYFAGEKGRNRVRLFSDARTGVLRWEWRENGRRCSLRLEHRDWDKAKLQADRFAAEYAWPTPEAEPEAVPLTLGRLFELYLGEVTPTKGTHAQKCSGSGGIGLSREANR